MGPAWTTIDSTEFHRRKQQGFFDLIIDTRRQDEWDAGHIPDAMLVESLQVSRDITSISGCRRCNVAVYCRTGQRSKAAADVLEENAFENVYDALGVTQWTSAGFPLVTTPSHTSACANGTTTCSPPATPPATPLPPPLAASDSNAAIVAACACAGILFLTAMVYLWQRSRRRNASTRSKNALEG